jgi:hypothetical protein
MTHKWLELGRNYQKALEDAGRTAEATIITLTGMRP